jgi:glycerophosphoryl diester phosphodiesterase
VDLPVTIPSLEELYESCGTAYQLSLDVKDIEVVDAVVALTRQIDASGLSRLWLCHSDVAALAQWRLRYPEVRLVNSTELRATTDGPKRRAATLVTKGVDAVNLRAREWTRELIAVFHQFDRLAFGWDLQSEAAVLSLFKMDLDAFYSDRSHVIVRALKSFTSQCE